MSQGSQGSGGTGGIFSLFFREAGLFWEQAFKWSEARADEIRQADAKREERRRMEAEANLLEQARRAKEAGLDVNAVLARGRDEPRRLA